MNASVTNIEKYPGYACIQLTASEHVKKQPVHLCVVLDTSASMDSENKLENVRQSIKFLLNYLGPEDMLSLVTFSQYAKVVINKAHTISDEKEYINARISLIKSESNTNLSGGIIAAQDCLLNNSTYKQSIIILTDGHANVGVTASSDITKLSSNLSKLYIGTSISCVGYGTDHHVEVLQSISSEGGGSYYVVNNMEDVAMAFGDILGGLFTCVAQQVTVHLPIGTDIKSRYAIHNNDKTTDVIIGDMPCGMEAAFIAKLDISTNINITGYDLIDNEKFSITATVNNNTATSIQTKCEAHYLRFIVLELIERVRNVLSNGSIIITTEIMNDIKRIIQEISAYKQKDSNSIWDMLLEELKECEDNLTKYNINGITFDSQTSAQVLGQRTTFLGRMKGIAARTMSSSNPVLMRGFSNNTQKHISSQLQTMATPYSQGKQQEHPHTPILAASDINASTLPLPPIMNLTRQIGRCSSDNSEPMSIAPLVI